MSFSASECAESMFQPTTYSGSAGVKEDHVVSPVFRDAAEHLIDEIAVRVDDAHPVARRDVLQDHRDEERRLARARGSHDVHVAHPGVG